MTSLNFGVSPEKMRKLHAEMSRLGIVESDLTEQFYHASGKGGQHVNKVATAVRLRHGPSDTTVTCQKNREQRLNRYHARVKLCEALDQATHGGHSKEAQRIAKLRKQKKRRKRRSNAADST